jgi:hypothetical protein
MHLARGEVKACWIAKRVTTGVDFCGQPAFGFADAFGCFVPPFAPAAC